MVNLISVLIPLITAVMAILAATHFHKLRVKAREKGIPEGMGTILLGEIVCAIFGGFAVALTLLLIMAWIALVV